MDRLTSFSSARFAFPPWVIASVVGRSRHARPINPKLDRFLGLSVAEYTPKDIVLSACSTAGPREFFTGVSVGRKGASMNALNVFVFVVDRKCAM
jgi:hypothetical protein